MAHYTNQSPLCIPEYTGASVVLHAGCLTLLFLNLHYYISKEQPLTKPQEQQKPTEKKEPRVIMKRVPVTPTPKIDQEAEQQAAVSAPQEQIQEKSDTAATTPQAPTASTSPSTSQRETTKFDETTPGLRQDKTTEDKTGDRTPGLRDHTIAPEEQVEVKEQITTVHKKIMQKVQRAERVKRTKMQHSWYTQQKISETQKTTRTTARTNAAATHEMALAHLLQTTQPSSKLSQAQQLAENFKRDFQEAAVNDYISAIHHAIAFSLNRMRIMLSPAEIPPQITMNLTITKHGAITHTRVFIHGQDNPSLSSLIKQAILQAAPFRPFPPSITTPELNLSISAYPDGSHASAANYSSRPTPLLFTLLRPDKHH